MSTWVLKQWPLPLVAAAALVVMLAAQRFGVGVGLPTYVPQTRVDATAKLEGLPLVFEENRGQADPQVRFITRGGGYTQFVTQQEVVWRLDGEQYDHAVRMSFPGGRSAPVHGEDALAGRTSYLKGADPAKWVAGAQQFAAVRVTDLYPGISLKLYGTRQRPEYDFILEPGADPDVIRLRFAGAERIEVGARGELIVHTSVGELIHHRPVAYQRDRDGQSRTIAARFVQIEADELRFELGRYDRSRPLVIDPVYEYSTYLGGNNGSEGLGGAVDPWQSIAVNGAGEVYAVGVTNADDFPTTAGVLQPALNEDLDFFIVKLNAAGDALLYSTYIGGTRDEVNVGGIAVTANGEVLFGGLSQSTDFPTTPGAFEEASNSAGGVDGDVVALRLNATGTALVYSTYLSSSATEKLFGFAADSAGSIYLAGSSPPNAMVALQTTAGVINTIGDQFIAKLLPDGSGLAYLTRWGKDFGGEIRIRAIALDGGNNIYITGLTSATDLPVSNAFDTTLDGGFDAYVTKINATATGIFYSTYLGGNNVDEPRAIAVDSAGSAYVAGTTGNFPVTAGAFRTTITPNHQGFVAKLSPAGNSLVWATYFTRPGVASTNAIALDSSNRVYVTNEANPPLDLRVGESPEACLSHVSSPSLSRLSADGTTVEYGMRIGAPMVFTGGSDISAHLLNDIAVDSGNNVYMIGSTNSGDFPTYRGFQGSRPPGFGSDAYIAKLSDAAPGAMPTLAFSSATYSGSEATGSVTITVNRTGRAAGPVQVRAVASAGTATATADYAPTDVILQWRNGDMAPKTFDIPIVNDGAAEGAETVNLALTKNWCLGDLGAQSTAVLTINDGASPPPPLPSNGTLQLSAATYTAAEGAGNATITITRTGGSAGAVSARLATSDGSAAAAADYTATDTVVNFADGDTTAKTVNVPILQDTADEPNETVNLTLSTPTGGATLGAQTSAALTITDDDPTPSSPPPPPAPPGGGGGGGGGGASSVWMLLWLAGLLAARQRRITLAKTPRSPSPEFEFFGTLAWRSWRAWRESPVQAGFRTMSASPATGVSSAIAPHTSQRSARAR